LQLAAKSNDFCKANISVCPDDYPDDISKLGCEEEKCSADIDCKRKACEKYATAAADNGTCKEIKF